MSLKYRTSAGTSASNFTDLVVKVGDTLPIGTEVDYDGQTAPAGWQEIDDPNVYSTTETKIGTWIDGKPLYRKVVAKTFSDTIGPPSNPGIAYETIDHGISNIRTCVKCTCVLVNTNGNTYTLPVMGYDPNLNRPQFTSIQNFNYTSIGLRICNDTWSTNNTFYFECLYTKTTD